MSAKKITYQEARKLMQPGDVIAFGGKGHFSELIKFATFSIASHVAAVLQTRAIDEETDRIFNQIIESAAINDFSGVSVSRFSDRINLYDGELWWLPLKKEVRDNSFDGKKFFNFLFNQARQRKPYDLPQAITSAIDVLDTLPFGINGPGYNREDFSKFFCSELVAAGLQIAGVVENINSSEITPIELCRWSIYEDHYYQLKGESSKEISRFNSISPEHSSDIKKAPIEEGNRPEDRRR